MSGRSKSQQLRAEVSVRGQSVPWRTNQLAIAALICALAQIIFAFLTAIPAVILGHMARRQIRETGENGDGMALAALILGYIGIGLLVVAIVLLMTYFAAVSPPQ